MRHGDNISLPDSVIETSKPVKLKDFAEHYRIMSADSDFRFSEEYEELKHVGREKACAAADLPCNRPKNRFTNILPYDHSRVKLQPCDDDEGSDYINANFVPGFNSPREFIVTQGPLHSTRDDFWRMCWETNSRAIVMLTVSYLWTPGSVNSGLYNKASTSVNYDSRVVLTSKLLIFRIINCVRRGFIRLATDVGKRSQMIPNVDQKVATTAIL